jgi:hypothetical protein
MSDESVSDEILHLHQQRIQEKVEEVGKQEFPILLEKTTRDT